MAERRRVFVAAGSNVEPRAHLRRALAALRGLYPDLEVSPAYANPAVGFEGDDFVNLVVGFTTDEPLESLIEHLRGVETLCGRPRDAPKWAPRSMDLDILLYGELCCDEPGLVLPRPDLVKRPYMLGPMADLAPQLRHPTLGLEIGDLWARFDRGAHPLQRVADDAGAGLAAAAGASPG